ncbi:baculoviral IAP repeat-containing protein 2-like [Eriocheir sinensis]|uniref:baculoviral IAP repeat-containing protein 2-like n=1 Tax=Eriocheir sinensis TaxID=95602 RepID=UPI0021C98D62|nr:baculoviral IAP repeat-containing protein 2-like [Eriocheir sinensis]
MTDPLARTVTFQSPQQRPLELRRERRFHSLSDVVFENVRRQTFTNWPVPFMDPGQLAQAGFFYLQKHDHVQCAFCRGVVGYWDPADHPFEEHRKHFSSCRFVSGLPTGNVPLYHPADDTGRVYRLLEEYHQFRVSSTRPVGSAYHSDSTQADAGQMSYPQFNTENARRQTFREWPQGPGLAPETLLTAGFFYTGLSDWVQCFHCGGGLFAWRRNDDPAADHARYYPWCPFIRTVTGKAREQWPWGDNMPPPAVIRPIDLSRQEEDLLLAHPLAKRLVEMGLTPGSVKAALKGRLERTGRFCLEVSEALELVFDYEENKRSTRGFVADSGLREAATTPMETTSVQEAAVGGAAQLVKEMRAKTQRLRQEVTDLERQLEEEKRRLVCRVCKERRVEVVLQPCSHLHLCAPCARPLDRCPTCDAAVRGTLRPILG